MITSINNKLSFFRSLGMSKILVSCSGGPDSMLLLNQCQKYCVTNNIQLRAVHINHNIQDDNSYWAEFVKKQCDGLDIELITCELNIQSFSNLEEVARIGRQSRIKEIIKSGEWLLTGHHANDQAEQIIMSLARSGGHHALGGFQEIAEIQGYKTAKPMLGLSKKEITNHCIINNIEHVIDKTNFNDVQDRNFVRNKVIPLLETRWPQFVKSANKSASIIRNVSDMVNENVDTSKDFIGVDDDEVLRIWLKKKYGKSAGNNIINQIYEYSKSNTGHVINQSGFQIGVWKKNVWDLREKKEYKKIMGDIKYKKDLQCVSIGGINKKLKKVFKEFDIPPWERNNIPFTFENGRLVAIGNEKIRVKL